MQRIWLISGFIFYLFMVNSFSQQNGGHPNSNPGSIKGQVVDAETREPLPGVNVTLKGTQTGAATDDYGQFAIPKVPVGSYNVVLHHIGYKKMVRADVIVRPDRITYVNVGLFPTFIEGKKVVIKAGYFLKEASEPISVVCFNAPELPGYTR